MRTACVSYPVNAKQPEAPQRLLSAERLVFKEGTRGESDAIAPCPLYLHDPIVDTSQGRCDTVPGHPWRFSEGQETQWMTGVLWLPFQTFFSERHGIRLLLWPPKEQQCRPL